MLVPKGHTSTQAILICLARAALGAAVTSVSELLSRDMSGSTVLLELVSVMRSMVRVSTRGSLELCCAEPSLSFIGPGLEAPATPWLLQSSSPH